jgi:hypothetical protein
MVFADDGNGSGVLRPIPATAFAVVVIGIGVETGAGIAWVAFGSFFGYGRFFDFFFFDPSDFTGFGLTLFTSLSPLRGEDVRLMPRLALRGAPHLTGTLALLAQFGGFPGLLSLGRPTRLATFVRSAAGSREDESRCDKSDRHPAHEATIGTSGFLSKNA